MLTVANVSLRKEEKPIWFNASLVSEIKKGDNVLVDIDDTTEFGRVLEVRKIDDKNNLISNKIVRLATSEDVEKHENNLKKEAEALPQILEKVKKFNLDMKLVDVKYFFDGSKLLITYTSDDRVDFRELVKDLASTFKTRIELKQIGARDEAKMCGICGVCGQELCCKRFLDDYKTVSIKMAKAQGLSLNPTKINGVCGKLLCCLQYEYSTYKELSEKLPSIGTKIKTDKGNGIVVYQDILKQKVTVKFEKDDAVETVDYDVAELKF